MAGTNAVAAKQALVAKLAALPGLSGVQVAYSWPGSRAERECVHGGKVTFDQNPAAYRGGGRQPRNEDVTVLIHVVVHKPGATVEDTDTRAVEIGTVIEDAVAADPTLSGATNLKIARIDGGELDHEFDDDSAASVLDYRFILRSRLD